MTRRRRRRSLVEIVAVAVAPLALAGARPVLAAGVLVEGTVKIGQPVARPAAIDMTKDAAVCGTRHASEALVVADDGGLANVVVSLRPTTAPAAEPARLPAGKATIDQQGCRYLPHVQAVTAGSELVLVNSDRVLHNVHGNLGAVTVFNLAMPIKGQRLPTRLARPGLVRLQCDAGHTWMNAWIQVFSHPLFAVTDGRGHFEIRDVPAGAYTLEYWHEPLDGKGAGTVKTRPLVVGDTPARADAALDLLPLPR